jgi:hypothetical protein
MIKKLMYTISAILLFSTTSFAGDMTSMITTIHPNCENRFELSLENGGSTRYYIDETVVGTDRFKMLYTMALMAFNEERAIWVNFDNPVANTANTCPGGTGNAYGASVTDIALSR